MVESASKPDLSPLVPLKATRFPFLPFWVWGGLVKLVEGFGVVVKQ